MVSVVYMQGSATSRAISSTARRAVVQCSAACSTMRHEAEAMCSERTVRSTTQHAVQCGVFAARCGVQSGEACSAVRRAVSVAIGVRSFTFS